MNWEIHEWLTPTSDAMRPQSPRLLSSKERTSVSKGMFMRASIAKFCGTYKQHFASAAADSGCMSRTINQIVASALRFYMADRWSQTSLGKASGVAANTIGNAMSPARRATSASGKEPSIKLTELARIADALGVTVADLTSDLSDEDRRRAQRKRAAEFYERNGHLPPWAPQPPTDSPQGKRDGTHG